MSTVTAPSPPQVQNPIAPSKSRTRLYIFILFATWALVYLTSLRSPALLDDVDSIYAEAAREVLVLHDWVTPHVNGVRFFDKPPLFYWMMASSMAVFGQHDWAARLVLALIVLATTLEVFRLGKKYYGEEGGFYAALATCACFGVYLFTRIMLQDVMIGLWLMLGIDFFLMGLEQEKPSLLACWGFAAAAALNVLTKGLIGIVFPSAICGLYLILTGNLRHLKKMRVVTSTLILLAIALPWHWIATVRNGPAGEAKGFFWYYIINEHFLRYVDRRIPRDYDIVPLRLFIVMTLLWLFPWCAFLPQALGEVPRKWREWREGLDARGRANLIFFLWAFVVVFFFCFSTRQEYYTLPVVPAMALLVGGWLGRESESPYDSSLRKWGVRSVATLLVIGTIVFAVTMYFGFTARSPKPGADISDVLTQNPAEYALSLGHFLDLTTDAMGFFHGPLEATGIAFLLGPLASYILRKKRKMFAANMALAAMMVVVLWCMHLGYKIFAPVITSQQFVAPIEKNWEPGALIVVNGDYESGSSLNFYTHEQLHLLNGKANNIWFGSTYPDAPHIFENDASFVKLWQSDRRIFLWTMNDNKPLVIADKKSYLLARSGGKQILTNKPVASR